MDTIKYNDEFENRNKVCGAFCFSIINAGSNGIFAYIICVKKSNIYFCAIIFLIVCIYSENEQKITDNKKVYGVLKCLFICIVGISVLGNLVSINA